MFQLEKVSFCCIRSGLNRGKNKQKPLQEIGHTSTKKIIIYIDLVILAGIKHNYKAFLSSH